MICLDIYKSDPYHLSGFSIILLVMTMTSKISLMLFTNSSSDSSIISSDAHQLLRAQPLGALVLVVPTVDTVEEAIQARNWAYFPPLGRRSLGGGQAFDANMWGGVPGGYRATINDNLVLILLIETLEGVKNAREIYIEMQRQVAKLQKA